MLVDYERVLLGLKEHIATKPHHGQRELAVVIAALEVENRVEEGLPERTLRLYGLEFFEEAVREPSASPSERGSVPASDDEQVRALRGDSAPESQEDTHVRRNTRTGRRASRHPAPRVGAGQAAA